MKKALGILAVLGSAAALVAYKLKKEEENTITPIDNLDDLSEDDISARILRTAEEANTIHELEEPVQKPATTTATYPHLNEEDMTYLNEVSEQIFATMDESVKEEKERPLQHTIHFEIESNLENFKNVVINEGYVVTTGEDENDLLVLNISEVNADMILSKVFYLADLAKEHQGRYVNWIIK